MRASFWSLSELKQPVNQWLCIAFLGILCFWVVLFWATDRARNVGATYNFSPTSQYDLGN